MRKTTPKNRAWAALGLLALGLPAGRAAVGQAPAPVVPPGPTAPTPPVPAPPTPPAPPTKYIPRVAMHMEMDHGKTIAVLTINEREGATIRTTAGGFPPEQRAQVAVERLTSLLQKGLTATELAAKPATKPTWDVEAGGGTLLLATPDEASAHHLTPEALARAWVHALRLLVAEPPLTLTPSSLVVPLGETRAVRVGGSALAGDIQVSSDNTSAGTAVYDPDKRTVTVQGRAPGRSTLTVQLAPGKGSLALTLPVVVMKYAGQVTPSVTVQVTGNPSAPAELVAQAAYAGLTRAISLEDGAQVALSAPPRLAAPLVPGAQTSALFPLTISGSSLLPVTAKAAINVVNTPIAAQTPSALFYSNNPEQVKHSQMLFAAHMRPSAATRLDYHHQNMSGQLLVFHVDLINDSDTPATVQVIAGLSQPGGDTVQVGRRAGAAFLKNLNANVGLVLPVPAHGQTPLVTQRFAPGLTVSGIMQVQTLTDAPLTLRVSVGGDTDTLTAPLTRLFMAGTGSDPLAAPSGASESDASNPLSPYVFPKPLIELSSRYVVDKRWAFIPLGEKEALRDSTGKFRLYGNYGADYQVTLTLTNPTRDTREVGVYFAPGAGPTAGVFQVDDGPIIEYDPFEPPDERELERLTLAPGETKVTRLRTIPLNGSAYPAELVAHALDKRPGNPPGPPVGVSLPVGATATAPPPMVHLSTPTAIVNTASPARKVSR